SAGLSPAGVSPSVPVAAGVLPPSGVAGAAGAGVAGVLPAAGGVPVGDSLAGAGALSPAGGGPGAGIRVSASIAGILVSLLLGDGLVGLGLGQQPLLEADGGDLVVDGGADEPLALVEHWVRA